ncbi:MAG: NBR1-Ig-like domain-containing protein, partial [bacterium]
VLRGSDNDACRDFVPIFGKGALRLQGEGELVLTSVGMILKNGAVISEQYDLYLDVRAGKPFTLSVQADETTTLTAPLWYEAPPATPTARPAATRQPSPTPTPCLPNASFGDDITIPDGTRLAPGARFTKIWRVRSNGCAAWPFGSSWVFVSGERLGAPASVPMSSVRPGSTADVSVEMVAPSAPGTYRGVWRMQDDRGRPFGDPLWVEIVVGNPLPTVRIPVRNETGGTLTLRLTGPATYNFTLATGTQ